VQALLFTSPAGRVFLTDEAATSSYGVPVVLVETSTGDRHTFGPGDELAPGVPVLLAVRAFLAPRMPKGTLRRAKRTDAALEAARRFCEALPSVPDYVAVPFGGMIGRTR